jgi:hypothetical protein
MFSLNPEIAQELAPIQAKKNHAENQKWLLQRCWIAGGCPTPAPLWTPLDLKHTFFQNWGIRTESKQDNKQTGHGVGSLTIIDMGCNCGGRAWSGRISNWPGRKSTHEVKDALWTRQSTQDAGCTKWKTEFCFPLLGMKT